MMTLQVLRRNYKLKGISRNKKTIANELSILIKTYDIDKSGNLDIGEFISMCAASESFALSDCVEVAYSHPI